MDIFLKLLGIFSTLSNAVQLFIAYSWYILVTTFPHEELNDLENNKLTRFGVSMDEKLLKDFDQIIDEKGYQNRSEAVRDLVRDAILQHHAANDAEVVAGTIMLFYNHHQNQLVNEMLRIQHNYHDHVLATTHLHIDYDNCLELIVVKGVASELRELSDQLITLKGVFYGKLTVSPLN